MGKHKISSPVVNIMTSRSYSQDPALQATADSALEASNSAPDAAGRHFIVDFHGAIHLTNPEVIEGALSEAATAAKAVLLHLHIGDFLTCAMGGVTGVALLAESHISVHTWPERDYAAFDIFMCGNSLPEKAIDVLKRIFQPETIELQEILRGQSDID